MKNIAKPISEQKVQIQLIAIWIFNFLFRVLPTHTLRTWYLRLFGARIGRGTAVHYGSYFTRPGQLEIGEYSTINYQCYLDTRGRITIGNCVMVGHRTRIYTAGHDPDSEYFDGYKNGVVIGDYAVIFPNTMIMPGVNIGRGAVILTGSVVTKNIDANVIAGGNPCKFIRHRAENMKYKHAYKYWLPNV